MINYLTEAEWREAISMWRTGRDTLHIAKALNCPESLIYRWLPVYRERHNNRIARAREEARRERAMA